MILSVVPPRDAEATAQRLLDALQLVTRPAASPLYFADMNAVAPSTIKRIAAAIDAAGAPVTLIDGSIIGAPPRLADPAPAAEGSSGAGADKDDDKDDGWIMPSMPTSGPVSFGDIPGCGAALAAALHARHVGPEIGASSGLKMCFATLSKGFGALAVQSFTTAHRLGVLGDLRHALATQAPARGRQAEAALVGLPPKAYRWVREMEEIARTHAEEGGFAEDLFRGAAGVYRAVAEDPVLGAEKVGRRKRGTTADDVAAAMAQGLERKRKKME